MGRGPGSKRNLTFNLLDPDQIRLTLCYTNYRSLNWGLGAPILLLWMGLTAHVVCNIFTVN